MNGLGPGAHCSHGCSFSIFHVCISITKTKKVIDKTGYLKSLQWIRKDIFIPVKGRILVKKGKRIKLFSAKDITKINGIWTAKTLQMITTKNKKLVHKSVFQLKSIKYNTDIGDGIFTTEVMQSGL